MMLDPKSSPQKLASPHRLSAGKYLALVGLVGVGLAGLWYSAKSDLELTLDLGKLNEPHRVLIYAHGDKGIEDWVNAQILTAGPYPFRVDPSPVKFHAKRANQRSPTSLDEMLEHADNLGFGYIALDLKGPSSDTWVQLLKAAHPEVGISERARWAVIRSDRRSDSLKVHLGTIQSGIHASAQAKARASLMQAIFLAPDILELAEPDNITTLGDLPLERNGVNLARIAWHEFSFAKLSQLTIERWPAQLSTSPHPKDAELWLAEPMQQVKAEPLSDQALLLKSAAIRWSNPTGPNVILQSTAPTQGWMLDIAIRADPGLQKLQCEGISGVRALGVRTSLDGKVIELRRSDHGHQVFSLEIDPQGRCQTQLLGQTPASSEPLTLGLPDLSGKSSWLAAGQAQKTLTWRHNSQTGKVTLPERSFVRERWQWQKDGSLLALTRSGDGMAPPYALEKISINPKHPDGLEREVISEFNALQDAEKVLAGPSIWPEIGHTQERRFGANLRQATYRPTLD